MQPPAFAIAEALIKDTAHLTFVGQQAKQSFAQLMRNWIKEYKRANCSAEDNQYNEKIKAIREECASHCHNDHYTDLKEKIQNFRKTLLQSSADLPIGNRPVWDEFVQLITQAIMQRSRMDASVKGKAHATESVESELSPERIYQLILDILKYVLQKSLNWQRYVNEMMDLVAIIFHDEINDFAKILATKQFSPVAIAEFSKRFSSKLIENSLDSTSNTETIEQFINGLKNLWRYDLENWANEDNRSDINISDRLIKLIKSYKNIADENIIKRDYWFLLRYVQHLDDKYKAQIRELPKLSNTVEQFVNWYKSTVQDKQNLLRLDHYLKEKNIDQNMPLHKLEPDFSMENKTFGDDTTVVVAYMLDPALEIVRAMVLFNHVRSDHSQGSYSKSKREALWQQLCALDPANKPTMASLAHLIAKLCAEKQVGQLGLADHYDSRIAGKKLEDLKSHIVQSYTEDELLSLEQFFILKTKLQVELTGIQKVTESVVEKSAAHVKLKAILLNSQLSALEICGLYNELAKEQFALLNKHGHSIVDYWLGITVTRSWSLTLKSLRDDCLAKLMHEISDLRDAEKYVEALALLNNAVMQPLFNTHRNNSIFTGAFGDTTAAKEIRKQIVIVTGQLEASQKLREVGGALDILRAMKY